MEGELAQTETGSGGGGIIGELVKISAETIIATTSEAMKETIPDEIRTDYDATAAAFKRMKEKAASEDQTALVEVRKALAAFQENGEEPAPPEITAEAVISPAPLPENSV